MAKFIQLFRNQLNAPFADKAAAKAAKKASLEAKIAAKKNR